MASSKGMAPTVLLPTVPQMGSSASVRATKGTSSRASSRVVKVPKASVSGRGLAKAPKIKVAKPKMPKDAMRLNVPKAKRVKNGKEFVVGRKPII